MPLTLISDWKWYAGLFLALSAIMSVYGMMLWYAMSYPLDVGDSG